MTPSKKKLLKPKEVTLDPSLKEETPTVELPNNENKLFDEDDDIGTSTIPHLSLPNEDEEEEVKSNNVWEYAIDVLLKLSPLHPEGKCLRKWVKYQEMETMEQFYQWNENEITIGEPHTSFLENSWDKSNLEVLRTNFIRNLHMLWKYIHHLVREAKESSLPGNAYSILLPDQFCNLTWKEFMAWRLKTPIREQTLDPAQDTEDIPNKTSGTNPIRMPINSLPQEKHQERGVTIHNTQR